LKWASIQEKKKTAENCERVADIRKEGVSLEGELSVKRQELRELRERASTLITSPVIVDKSFAAPTRTDIDDAPVALEDTRALHRKQIDGSVRIERRWSSFL